MSKSPVKNRAATERRAVTLGTRRSLKKQHQAAWLVNAVRLIDLTDGAHVEREMLLAKVTLAKLSLSDLKVLVELFNGCIIDICQSNCTVEITGTGERLDAFVEACGRTQFIELVRSGVSGISRGA